MSAGQIRALDESMPGRLTRAGRTFGRSLTLAEKILVSHCHDFETQQWERGKAILRLRVDRVAFIDAADYDRFEPGDRVSITGLYALEPGQPVKVQIKKPDGRVDEIQVKHRLTREQIAWFKAGSALNAGQPVDLATGGKAEMQDVKLEPQDTRAKPGKDA